MVGVELAIEILDRVNELLRRYFADRRAIYRLSWVGSRSAVRECFIQFAQHYNFRRPHQALDGRTPVEEII